MTGPGQAKEAVEIGAAQVCIEQYGLAPFLGQIRSYAAGEEAFARSALSPPDSPNCALFPDLQLLTMKEAAFPLIVFYMEFIRVMGLDNQGGSFTDDHQQQIGIVSPDIS